MCTIDWLVCNKMLLLQLIVFLTLSKEKSMSAENTKPYSKKVLVDLSILKHLNCGLGQIAYNYAKYFGEHADEYDFEIHLLLPKSFVGHFGNKVYYHVSHKIYKIFPCLLKGFDVWHSIHQLSGFVPSDKSIKNILTVHDLNFIYEKQRNKLKKAANKLTYRINRADKIVAISNFAKSDLLKFFPDLKDVEVVYNGVEFGNPDDHGKMPQAPFDGSKKFLFTIGQVLKKKNFHVLLDAMKLLPEYNLYIAGSNSTPYGCMMRDRISSEKISNVCMLGEISNEERTWLYSNCEAFVFPSMFEGFGLPVIEALSFGKPVVSSQMTSLAEIGSSHVFFLDSFEPDHIAEMVRKAISEYAEHPELAKSNADYARSFSYDKHMKKYLEIYRSML